jgi:hypothetical protein
MIVRALQGLRLWVTAPVLRRAIAVVCAIAFVLVSFAHTLHHFNGPSPTAIIQADLGAFDDGGPSASKKASFAIEHCHGCSMIATAVLPPLTTPDRIAADLPARKFDQQRPHTPVTETPPPISSI